MDISENQAKQSQLWWVVFLNWQWVKACLASLKFPRKHATSLLRKHSSCWEDTYPLTRIQQRITQYLLWARHCSVKLSVNKKAPQRTPSTRNLVLAFQLAHVSLGMPSEWVLERSSIMASLHDQWGCDWARRCHGVKVSSRGEPTRSLL